MGRLLFRTLLLTYARKDSIQDLDAGGRRRIRMLGAMLQMAKGSGLIPDLINTCRGRRKESSDFKPVPFAALENSFGPLPPGAEATLTRFFRVKIQSLHFCGRAFYGLPLIEGFQHLALLFPVILWLARWRASAEARSSLSDADIQRAITLVDHHHGYSPILATAWSRQRVRLLSQRDDISRLCYSLAG
jgi:lysine-N-methylase